ncbi:MAG: c-type cytochrome [Anaerolineales bacterium]|nr:c-type cytochrome [Anaerolineales bacterium]
MKIRFITTLLLMAVVLSACNFSLAEDITPPPNYVTPTPAPTLGPLYPSTPPSPARGAAIFAKECATCHGEKGLGNGAQAAGLPVPVAAIGLADISRQSSPAEWYAVVTQGRTDRYMPSFASRLSTQERWDVLAYVFSLSASADDVAKGALIYADKCAACHGLQGRGDGPQAAALSRAPANFTDRVGAAHQNWMSKATGIGLYRAISEGVAPNMPGFSPELSEADRVALVAYLRSLTFDLSAPKAIPTSTPEATATLEAQPATPDPQLSTPEAAVTNEASATPEIAVGTVSGTVVNATGNALPTGLTVTLRGFDHGSEASTGLAEAINLSVPLASDGAFNFENVEMPAGRLFLAQVTFTGVPYQSGYLVAEAGMDRLALPPLNIYETTNDTALLTLDQTNIAFDFSSQGVAQVYEIYILTNSSVQTIVILTDGQSLPFIALPENAQNVGFDLAQGSAPLLPADGGFAIQPSTTQYGIVAFFTLPYDKKLEVTQPFKLAAESVTLFLPEGFKVKGDQLTDAGIKTIQGNSFQTYTTENVKADSSLTFTVRGSTKTSTGGTSLDTKTSLIVGLGGLGIVLILAGVYLFFRERARPVEPEEGEEEETPEDALGEDPASLTDAILALDDQFKSGGIAKEAYEKRRAELKARLKDLL